MLPVCRHERGLLQVVLKATTLGQMMIQMIGLIVLMVMIVMIVMMIQIMKQMTMLICSCHIYYTHIYFTTHRSIHSHDD